MTLMHINRTIIILTLPNVILDYMYMETCYSSHAWEKQSDWINEVAGLQ